MPNSIAAGIRNSMVSATDAGAVALQRVLNGQDKRLFVERRLIRQHATIGGDQKDSGGVSIVQRAVTDRHHADAARQDGQRRVVCDAQATPARRR